MVISNGFSRHTSRHNGQKSSLSWLDKDEDKGLINRPSVMDQPDNGAVAPAAARMCVRAALRRRRQKCPQKMNWPPSLYSTARFEAFRHRHHSVCLVVHSNNRTKKAQSIHLSACSHNSKWCSTSTLLQAVDARPKFGTAGSFSLLAQYESSNIKGVSYINL